MIIPVGHMLFVYKLQALEVGKRQIDLIESLSIIHRKAV